MKARLYRYRGNPHPVSVPKDHHASVFILPVVPVKRKAKLPRKLQQQMTKLDLMKRLHRLNHGGSASA